MRRLIWVFKIKCLITIGVGPMIGRQGFKWVEPLIQQVRRCDIAQRLKHGFDAAGMLFGPVVEEPFDLLPLKVFLRSAEVAGDDGKGLQFCLAIAPDGRAIAFSILGNNLAQGDQISRARSMQEAMVRRIVRELSPPAPR